MRSAILLCSLLTATATLAELPDGAEQNWYQWRGPHATGVAPEGDPPTEWDEQTNIRWKKRVPGRGSASPIVWEEKVFILTAEETDRLAEDAPQEDGEQRGGGRFGIVPPRNYYRYMVLCLDRQTGEVQWQKVAREAVPHEGGHATNTHASASPTTDGKHLYASFGSQGIYCYTLDGDLVWSRDLGDMETRNQFGEGASPTIYGDTLLVNWDHEGQSKLYALHAASGQTRWEQERDEPTTWNTPLAVEGEDRTQVIVNGTNRSRSYDLKTGELIWECGGQVSNPIPSPVALDDLVYVMTGHRGSSIVAIPLSARGDITDSEEIAWSTRESAPYVPSPLLYKGRLYFTKANTGIFSSLQAEDGKAIIDQKRLPAISNVYASPVAADDRIYITGRDGTTLVIRHADQLEVLATNTVGEPVDASPAIAGDQIFIRGENHLFCIEE